MRKGRLPGFVTSEWASPVVCVVAIDACLGSVFCSPAGSMGDEMQESGKYRYKEVPVARVRLFTYLKWNRRRVREPK